MDAAAKLMIQNGTPFPMTWAHLEYEDARTNPENVLQRTLGEKTGQVIDDVRPGRVRVVCAFETDETLEHTTRCVGPYLDMRPDAGFVVWAVYDRGEGFGMRTQNARLERDEEYEGRNYRRRFVWDGKPVARRS